MPVEVAWPQGDVGLSFDDGIARLVPTPELQKQDPDRSAAQSLSGRAAPAPEGCPAPGAGHPRLTELVQAALSGPGPAVMEITGEWSQDEPLEITTGHRVVLYGSSSEDLGRACITLPGVRVIGGSLMLVDLELTATEENRVQGGCLQCVRCSITSRNGCGVLCLQKSNVSLQGCEIMRCMRSGIGINGKNVELDVKQCLVSRNVFSGIGVNHQARSIALRDNCITQNGLHGIWLNVGVTAHWHGGDLSGNRLTDQAGAGQLVGYTAPGAE